MKRMKGKAFLFFVWHDSKARFAGTKLGMLWGLASPLVTVGIYWFVYTVALKGTQIGEVRYLPWLLAGILPWFFFSEALNGAASCFYDYRFLICKTQFPKEQLPTVRVSTAFGAHLLLLGLTYPIFLLSGLSPQPGQLWVVLWLVAGFLLAWGVGRMLAVWAVRLRDIPYAVNVALQLGFWITPIFWSDAMLPPLLKSLCGWNPMAILAEGYRSALLYAGLPGFEKIARLGVMLLFFCGTGTFALKKTKPTLADWL